MRDRLCVRLIPLHRSEEAAGSAAADLSPDDELRQLRETRFALGGVREAPSSGCVIIARGPAPE